ncbi:YfiT family bacillithiol transferase [Paenibacillus yanchengensis]|uniref:YfiT family bacillithiol transferase n=1 Tax=Paenibacillus yanchengensis TaxID=2035833 RepID=A0ABW4YMM2_9BACL
MEDLRYPIGKFEYIGMSVIQRTEWIEVLEQFPNRLEQEVAKMTETQLDTPYRPDGWTMRQVIHHLADALMNSYIRFKLAMTESNPTIKPFDPDGWVNTVDSRYGAVASSVAIIQGVTTKLVHLLRGMEQTDFHRQFYHPERGSQVKLAYFLGWTAWHVEHHLAHITSGLQRLDK